MVRIPIHHILFFALLTLVAGCGGREEGSGTEPEVVDDGLVFVARQDMMRAPGLEGTGTQDAPDPGDPIIISNFKAGDLLYFSQMPQGQSPNFDGNDDSTVNYMYVYEYKPDQNANWSEGYNFQVKSSTFGFDWDRVLAVGPSGNAFKFFGFHFPVGQQPVWRVQEDQTGGEENPFDTKNFMSSDIMGAYHATSAIFTRMRFRLFHLMTYLMVKIYVPVYEGKTDDPDKLSYSGFNEDALKEAIVTNAITDFRIEWAASKSSDSEAPLVQTDNTSGRHNIKMYRHQIDETSVTEIKVPDYYGNDVEGIVDGIDRVRTYQFSVLFPTQTFDSNFLRFALKTPGGDTVYYYFKSEYIREGTFGLTQGTLQELDLYLPRNTNQTIVVGAKILPWKEAETEMTVNKQTDE